MLLDISLIYSTCYGNNTMKKTTFSPIVRHNEFDLYRIGSPALSENSDLHCIEILEAVEKWLDNSVISNQDWIAEIGNGDEYNDWISRDHDEFSEFKSIPSVHSQLRCINFYDYGEHSADVADKSKMALQLYFDNSGIYTTGNLAISVVFNKSRLQCKALK